MFWIVDNGSSPRGQKAADRLIAAFPNAVMVHTPVHASWLNQVEVYFSAVQHKALSPNDFTDFTDFTDFIDFTEVRDRVRAFEDRYNATTQPFQWRSPPPTSTIYWPGSTGTPPITTRNPLSHRQHEHPPPKDLRRRPLSSRQSRWEKAQ